MEKTRIHKNTLLLRLNELVNNGIVRKHYPTFHNYKDQFFKHHFYLLNWNKKESRDIVSHAFDSRSAAHDRSLIPYRINTIQNGSGGIDKIEPISFHGNYARDLEKRIISLDIEERWIVREIIQSYKDRSQCADRSLLFEKRDKILATLILACAQYFVEDLLLYPDRPWSHDFLISLLRRPLRLFDPPLRPYAKIYEIMQLLGF